MSRTVSIPAPVTPRPFDVDDFVHDAAIVEGHGDTSKMRVNVTFYEQAKLMRWDGKTAESIELTPRGTDLGASAGYIPEDPEPVVEAPPEPEVCSECHGSGKVVLFAYGSKCSRCAGSGEEPRGSYTIDYEPLATGPTSFALDAAGDIVIRQRSLPAEEIRRRVDATLALWIEQKHSGELSKHYGMTLDPDSTSPRVVQGGTAQAILGFPNLGEHGTLIDSEEVARSFVGKTVLIHAPATSEIRSSSQHGKVSTVIFANGRGFELRDEENRFYMLDWKSRGNVSLRIVD